MTRERADHTLPPTAIAGEAYLNLIEQSERNWENRAHFFAVATRSMRRILVDYARRKGADKRGGDWHRVDTDALAAPRQHEDVLAIHEALDHLSRIDERQGRIVELRYFGGLTEEEIAEVLGLSARTIKREWSVARAWLYAELTKPTA
jgi:RNA polymerase sigma-70 factor, ECF subfamily